MGFSSWSSPGPASNLLFLFRLSGSDSGEGTVQHVSGRIEGVSLQEDVTLDDFRDDEFVGVLSPIQGVRFTLDCKYEVASVPWIRVPVSYYGSLTTPHVLLTVCCYVTRFRGGRRPGSDPPDGSVLSEQTGVQVAQEKSEQEGKGAGEPTGGLASPPRDPPPQQYVDINDCLQRRGARKPLAA